MHCSILSEYQINKHGILLTTEKKNRKFHGTIIKNNTKEILWGDSNW